MSPATRVQRAASPSVRKLGAASEARRAAELYDREMGRAVQIAVPGALSVMIEARNRALYAFAGNSDPVSVAVHAMRELDPLIVKAMLLSIVTGYRRAAREGLPFTIRAARGVVRARRPEEKKRRRVRPQTVNRTSDVFDGAVAAAQRLLDMPQSHLVRLGEKLKGDALRVRTGIAASVEARLKATMVDIITTGAHVFEGRQKLSDAFKAEGVVPENSFTLEAIFRAQTSIAYNAARQALEDSPDFADLVWGFTYMTVGDDRVRPTHAAMDGTTLPRDDEFWDKNSPPNGWGCRCQRIVVLDEPDEQIRPPSTIDLPSGATVKVQPDKGWSFKAADVIGMDPADIKPGVWASW